jgi:predicted GIY-YIG superfamily endonuclease
MEEQRSTAIYRLFDSEGQLLYVGISDRPEVRWAEHALDKNWWHLVARKSVEWLSTRSAALAAEAEATKNERPVFNAIRMADGSIVKAVYDDSVAREKIKRTLLREIEEQVLSAGTQVTATGIARRFGVSARTAASAIRDLPAGLLEHRSNRTFVSGARPAPARPWVGEKIPHDLFWAQLA